MASEAHLKSHNCFASAIDSSESRVFPGWALRQGSSSTSPSVRGGKGDRQVSGAERGPLKQEGQRAPRERAHEPRATRAPHFPVLPLEELWLLFHPTDTFLWFLS